MGGFELVDGMDRRIFLAQGMVLTLAACGTTTAPTVGAAAKSLPPVAFDAALNAAAETHSRDMSVQNRPWHFGSDGSSPLVRAQRSGYTGRLLGENISETYETELETLSSWMAQPDTRVVIMDPMATRLGFSWFQEPGGKIWWTMLTGA